VTLQHRLTSFTKSGVSVIHNNQRELNGVFELKRRPVTKSYVSRSLNCS